MYANVKGGTGAGVRKPFQGGHGPRCACTKCVVGPVAWRNNGNMTPAPPAPKPYTQGA